MSIRLAIAVLLALAVLVSRAAGLHFHEMEPHHEVLSSSALHHDDGAHAFSELDHDHLLDHAEGAEDVDDSAMSATPQMKVPTTPLVAVLFFSLPMRIDGPSRAVVFPAPLRPPRLKDVAHNLPPSQGPPLAA